jgi:GT2 family glycosyltransferase
MSTPFVVNVILNTNRKQDTLACLASISESTYTNQQTIVLDNASSDGSAHAIRSAYPEVRIVELIENLGYAGNNNVGIKEALACGADWIFILNEDTLMAPDCLEKLLAAAQADHRIGIVGPMVYHHDEPSVIQSAGVILGDNWRSIHLGQNEEDCGQFPVSHQVDGISGCAILVRKDLVEQVGVLDERFYYYWEETEWCVRAKKHGWVIAHVPEAKLWHKGVQRDYRPNPSVTYYDTRNWLLLLSKHHAPLAIRLQAWCRMFRIMTSWTIQPKWKHMHGHRLAMWKGARDYLLKQWGAMPQ